MKKIFFYFLKFILNPILRLFIEKIEGEENLPQVGNYILSSNHADSLDHFFIGIILEKRLREMHFIGALDEPKTFLYAIILYYLADTIAINRRKVNREAFLDKVSEFLKAGEIIVIYPEGTTTKDEKKLLRGKTGAAELVLRTGVSVVPVGMKKNKYSRKRTIKIGRPLIFLEERKLAEKLTKDKDEYYLLLREMTDKLMREIAILCGKIYPF